MVCDLKNSADREVFEKLIAKADVYIQNFRPGAATRLGAGVDRLHKINPSLIYASINGFGSSGPYIDRPSYDSVAQALSGFLGVVVDPDRPRFLGLRWPTPLPAFTLLMGFWALLERTRRMRDDMWKCPCWRRWRTLQ
jgi:crotonobetainyl-CoA:carnitine CoA-transferase CaiB-like acyl-CoA transferase